MWNYVINLTKTWKKYFLPKEKLYHIKFHGYYQKNLIFLELLTWAAKIGLNLSNYQILKMSISKSQQKIDSVKAKERAFFRPYTSLTCWQPDSHQQIYYLWRELLPYFCKYKKEWNFWKKHSKNSILKTLNS